MSKSFGPRLILAAAVTALVALAAAPPADAAEAIIDEAVAADFPDAEALDALATAGPIKQSRSGICWCPGGSAYERTTNFKAFDNIEACLEAKGRHPKREADQGQCLTPEQQRIAELEAQLEATENALRAAEAKAGPTARCESMLKWLAGERTNSQGFYIGNTAAGDTIIVADDVAMLVKACRE